MPEVSVIVPFYKVAPFIGRCAEALMAQTLSDVEFLFVDPEELWQIVERIRDEEKMAVTAGAPLVLSAAQFEGSLPAAGAAAADRQALPGMDPAEPRDKNRKKQVSLAEMYKTITMELG